MAALPDPSLDLVLTPLSGDGRTLREWFTTFHLASVVIDPFTNESSWILETAARVMRQFRGAGVRVNWIIACGAEDARAFLGPLADEFLVFLDPDRTAIKALGLAELPAFVFLRSDGTVPAAAQGWSASTWRAVAKEIATTVNWSQPSLPAPGDPSAFRGTPALV